MSFLFALTPLYADLNYVEPGSLRLSHTLSLEGVFNKLQKGWGVTPGTENKSSKKFSKVDDKENPWKSEWGMRLLSEVATRVTPDIFGRALIEWQGAYADRLWRPLNTHHNIDVDGDNWIFREAEGRIDKDHWYLHGFSGTERPSWEAQGDFFQLYPENYPIRDYLGSSAYFGVYPKNWREDQYRNISRRAVARGGELGGNYAGIDGAVAYGDELSWGFRESAYARLRVPLKTTKLSFVYKNEDDPTNIFNPDDRNRAFALSWAVPFEAGHLIDVGVFYNPYRVGEIYEVARETSPGQGIQGSNVNILEKNQS